MKNKKPAHCITIGTPDKKILDECRKLLRQCSAESDQRQDLVLRAALRRYLRELKSK